MWMLNSNNSLLTQDLSTAAAPATSKLLCESCLSKQQYSDNTFRAKRKTKLYHMAPLTLEQVIARSMRLPTKRASRSLFESTAGGGSAAVGVPATPQQAKELGRFMERMEAAEEAALRDRPVIRSVSSSGVRNSQDLLTFLHSSRSMGAWQDALAMVESAAKHITLNVAHFGVVIDTCAEAKKWDCVAELIRSKACVKLNHEAPVRRAVELLCAHADWEQGLQLLLSLPPAQRYEGAYHEVLGCCQRALNWEGALSIVAGMKENDGGVKPTAQTYAMLLTVLENCGQVTMCKDLLESLPPNDKAAITAAYAALIHVWAESQYKSKKRF